MKDSASDLTADEQKHVVEALKVLRIRAGNTALLAKALRFKMDSLRGVILGRDAVSPLMVLRVARLIGIGLDDLLAGKYPVPGMCPHCGCVPPASNQFPILLDR
jgi:hypothetical protein